MPAAQTRGERTGTCSRIWDAPSQGGTIDGCEEEESEEDTVVEELRVRLEDEAPRLVVRFGHSGRRKVTSAEIRRAR